MTEKISGYPRSSAESRPADTQPTRRPTGTATAATRTSAAQADRRDAISLTETATRLKVIEARLADLPDVDRERVESLRALVESGDYEVNAKQIARKLIELERLL